MASTSRRRPERVARLEEAVEVLRALWTGGPVTRDVAVLPARATRTPIPVPEPPPPIIIGGETRAGARLAGRIGDGWTHFEDTFEANLPLYLEALEATGRRREDQLVLRRLPGRVAERRDPRRQPLGDRRRARPGRAGRRPAPTAPSYLARTTADVDALVGGRRALVRRRRRPVRGTITGPMEPTTPSPPSS